MAIFYFILKNGNGKLGFDFLLSLFKTIFFSLVFFPSSHYSNSFRCRVICILFVELISQRS